MSTIENTAEHGVPYPEELAVAKRHTPLLALFPGHHPVSCCLQYKKNFLVSLCQGMRLLYGSVCALAFILSFDWLHIFPHILQRHCPWSSMLTLPTPNLLTLLAFDLLLLVLHLSPSSDDSYFPMYSWFLLGLQEASVDGDSTKEIQVHHPLQQVDWQLSHMRSLL